MKTLTGTWIEWFAAAMLGVTTVFSWMHDQHGTAVVAAACAGVVAGLQLGVWAARRHDG